MREAHTSARDAITIWSLNRVERLCAGGNGKIKRQVEGTKRQPTNANLGMNELTQPCDSVCAFNERNRRGGLSDARSRRDRFCFRQHDAKDTRSSGKCQIVLEPRGAIPVYPHHHRLFGR